MYDLDARFIRHKEIMSSQIEIEYEIQKAAAIRRYQNPKFDRIETWRQEVSSHPIPPPLPAPNPNGSEFIEEESVTCASFWRLPAVQKVRDLIVKGKRRRKVKTKMYESFYDEKRRRSYFAESDSGDRRKNGLMERMERFARARKLLDRPDEKAAIRYLG